MQYASVYINRPLDRQLTYKIEPEILPYLSVGSLVEVPLGRTSISAVVASITKRLSGVEAQDLKPIKRLYRGFQLSPTHFELAEWLAATYACSFSEALFCQIPTKLPIRSKTVYTAEKTASDSGSLVTIRCNIDKRTEHVTMIIAKSLRQKRPVRLILPELDQSNSWQKHLAKQKIKAVSFKSQGTPSQQFAQLAALATADSTVIIGSRRLGLIPPRPKEVWIVLEPYDFAYKEDQTPKFDLWRLLQFWSKTTSIILLPSLDLPIVTTKVQNLEPNLPWPQPLHVVKAPTGPTSFAKWQYLIEELPKPLRLILPPGSSSRTMRCLNCGWTPKSPCCSRPTILQEGQIVCSHCRKNVEIPTHCLKCRAILTAQAGGMTRFFHSVISEFRGVSIGYLTDSWRAVQDSHTLITGFDGAFDSGDLWSLADLGGAITKINQASLSTTIATELPNHPVMQALNVSDKSRFDTQLLKLQQDLQWYPYFRVIRLVFLATNSLEAQELAQSWYRKLPELLKSHQANLTEPIPLDTLKERNRYGWCLFLHISASTWYSFSKVWRQEIRPQLKGSATRVDLDPRRFIW